ncbi:MAG TPA: serine/threonine-protein kinase [Polyangiaceae bacterium]|nr:serine/threonine-protein kinase [Polyangiaceae bacterium]
MSLGPGDLIDNKYRIVKLIGEGGMGSVHEGENVRIRRRVAIKVLHAHAANNADALTRFEREAQAAGHIGSDHIMEVLDVGVLADGDRYMVMEFLDGEPLSSRIRSAGSLTPQHLVPLLRQALSGLDAAHKAGIIHRDLKPDNIFIVREKAGKTDFVKLIDFGISKFNVLGGDMAMTSTGAVMGTPYYMSPEQAKGSRSVDARSDIYSMGVIAFEALTGQVPFDGSTFNELMFKIVLAEPPQLKLLRPDLDPAFVAIVEKMMARDANARYQTCKEVVAALDGWANQGQPVPIAAATVVSPTAKAAPAAVAPAGAAPATVGTSSTWATSQVDSLPKKSLAPVFVVGGATLLLLGGVALAVAKLTGSDDESVAAGAASSNAPSASAARGTPAAAPPTVTADQPVSAQEPAPPAASAPPLASSALAPAASADLAAKDPTVDKARPARAPSRSARVGGSTPSSPPKAATPSSNGPAKAREFGY